MADRSVIQWDKDDLEELGLLKVDVLALGMLSMLRRALELVGQRRGTVFEMQDIPAEDPATYDMICAADTVGVFQIESRAQMSMLPRLQPRRFYDLVIEVAIVRPGPIQGGMVHPYLQRREGQEPVDLPEPGHGRGAGAHAGRADLPGAGDADGDPGGRLHARRGRPAAPRDGRLEAQGRPREVLRAHRRRHAGSAATTRRSPSRSSARSRASASTAFPESHAASFALLVYASSWLKCHDPAAFLCALLNSQPMGFYSPSQLVQDARRHGVEVRPVDVDGQRLGIHAGRPGRCRTRGQPAVRLGLHMLRGMSSESGRAHRAARAIRPFADVADLARRARLDRGDLQVLAGGNALRALAGHRRQALWQAAGARAGQGPAAPDRAGRGHAGAGRAAAKARRSSATTARRASRWAAIRWRCCAPQLLAQALPAGRGAAGLPERPAGARLRHRHRAPAAGHGEGRAVPHARGRDRQRQRDRLAAAGRAAAPRGAECARCWACTACGSAKGR